MGRTPTITNEEKEPHLKESRYGKVLLWFPNRFNRHVCSMLRSHNLHNSNSGSNICMLLRTRGVQAQVLSFWRPYHLFGSKNLVSFQADSAGFLWSPSESLARSWSFASPGKCVVLPLKNRRWHHAPFLGIMAVQWYDNYMVSLENRVPLHLVHQFISKVPSCGYRSFSDTPTVSSQYQNIRSAHERMV